MPAKKSVSQSALLASELERFERNVANWVKLDPADAMYHRFQGILESQIVTLQSCGVITQQGAVKLHARMGTANRERNAEPTNQENL